MSDDFSSKEIYQLLTEIKVAVVSMQVQLKVIEECYVTKEEFEPVKKLVYGVVWLIVSGIVLAVMGLVTGKFV